MPTSKSLVNVSSLARSVSKKSKILVADVKIVATLLFDELSTSIHAGKKIKIKNFGTFRLRKSKSKWAHNPKDLAAPKVLIPPHYRLQFVPVATLKAAVKGMVVEDQG